MNTITELCSRARQTIDGAEIIYIDTMETKLGKRHLCYGIETCDGRRIARLGKGSQAVRELSESIINSDGLQRELSKYGPSLTIELTAGGYIIERQ